MKLTQIRVALSTSVAMSLLTGCSLTGGVAASGAQKANAPMFVVKGVVEAGIPAHPLKHRTICLTAVDHNVTQPVASSDRMIEGSGASTDGQGRFRIAVPMTRRIAALRKRGCLVIAVETDNWPSALNFGFAAYISPTFDLPFAISFRPSAAMRQRVLAQTPKGTSAVKVLSFVLGKFKRFEVCADGRYIAQLKASSGVWPRARVDPWESRAIRISDGLSLDEVWKFDDNDRLADIMIDDKAWYMTR